MVELPELVILLISQQLSYEDLGNLRVTCKRLKEIIGRRTPRSLHLLTDENPFERKLFHTGELVNHANTYHVRQLDILKSIKFRSQFIGLLKLTIYYTRDWDHCGLWEAYKSVDLNDLNHFEQLVHLELKWLKIETGKLSLRELKIAFFGHTYKDTKTSFELDCPRLEALGLGYSTQPRLTQGTGSSVRYLHVEFEDDSKTYKSADYLPLLYAKLQNLSRISFECEGDLNSFVLAVMELRVCLPFLSKIQLNGVGYDYEELKRGISRFESAGR